MGCSLGIKLGFLRHLEERNLFSPYLGVGLVSSGVELVKSLLGSWIVITLTHTIMPFMKKDTQGGV
jgi:hypothetical protein